MKTLLLLEQAALTAAAIYFLTLHNLGLPFWAWALLFFAPDIGMVGYLVNTRVGAFTYNLTHHRGLALALVLGGHFADAEALLACGILLFAHSAFDRILGYGLKYPDHFRHTHLGWIDGRDRVKKR